MDENNFIDINSLGQLTPDLADHIKSDNVKEYDSPEPFIDDMLRTTPTNLNAAIHYKVEQVTQEEIDKKAVALREEEMSSATKDNSDKNQESDVSRNPFYVDI